MRIGGKRYQNLPANGQLPTICNGGRIVITSGIAALPAAHAEAIVHTVQTFTDFNPDNDPHGQQDCAVLTAAGQQIIFKIDYYDRDMKFLSPAPSDPGQTCRVLTILLSSEH